MNKLLVTVGFRVALGAALGLGASACLSRAARTEDFMVSMRGYNDGVRWQRYAAAASAVPATERDAFLDERADLEEELRIDDWELLRVSYQGQHQQRAEVRVRYTWHLDRVGLVNETTTVQSWERRGKHWVIAEEVRALGPEMPGVAEPPPEAADARGSVSVDR